MDYYTFARQSALLAVACIISVSCESSEKNKDKIKKDGSVSMLTAEEADSIKSDSQGFQTSKGIQAYAIISPAEGSETVGVVSFSEVDGGVRIIADVAGLSPGLHGFHIHEHGDCGGTDMGNAGGHWNPTNTPHGGPDSPPGQRHVGDLGNLDANKDGIAHYNRVDTLISLKGKDSIIGLSVIVHADPDDLKSQPSGNSGKRIACGVIVESKK